MRTYLITLAIYLSLAGAVPFQVGPQKELRGSASGGPKLPSLFAKDNGGSKGFDDHEQTLVRRENILQDYSREKRDLTNEQKAKASALIQKGVPSHLTPDALQRRLLDGMPVQGEASRLRYIAYVQDAVRTEPHYRDNPDKAKTLIEHAQQDLLNGGMPLQDVVGHFL